MSLDWFAGLPGELTQTASATSSRHAWAARRSWLFDQPKTIVKT